MLKSGADTAVRILRFGYCGPDTAVQIQRSGYSGLLARHPHRVTRTASPASLHLSRYLRRFI